MSLYDEGEESELETSDLEKLSSVMSDSLKSKKLRASLSSKLELIEVDPALCKPWPYHNRDSAWLTKEHCKDLMNSISQNGQLEPALLRPIQGDPQYQFEVIFGVRRWFACSQIKDQKLIAYITHSDDKTCMILMHAENADSKDISDFERATSFAKQMRSGVFKNQTEMAEAMGYSQSTISKMIKSAEIFDHNWIESLFPNKLDISIRYAYTLSTLLNKPKLVPMIQEEALLIEKEQAESSVKLTSSRILKRLIRKGNPNAERSVESVLLAVDYKPAVSCYLDKLGKFHLVIESRAKTLSKEQIEQVCIKAMGDYLENNSIPKE